MFTGIIESTGIVQKIVRDRSNVHYTIGSPISRELKIDQSVSHNGVCLTVVSLGEGTHTVTAIEETLRRTNLGDWLEGTMVNLERSMRMDGRLDGHIVQGHVDATGVCTEVLESGGSWRFTFRYAPSLEHILVDKGSVCINGVSLTVIEPDEDQFSVAIIPYTWGNTNFQNIQPGDRVNLEFDVIGKYIAKYMAMYGGKGGC